jgi:hypothetical protein
MLPSAPTARTALMVLACAIPPAVARAQPGWQTQRDCA